VNSLFDLPVHWL